MQNNVSTLWIEGKIRQIDHVCLKSMVRAGLDVTLYHYGSLENLPDGIKTADASEILDLKLIERLQLLKRKKASQPITNFSDFFRIFLLKNGRGLWLDTDVFVFRAFAYDETRPFFAYEGHGRIGSPVFYVPQDHPIIGEYESLLRQDILMPNWLGPWRGIIRPTFWRLTGQAFTPPDLGITIYGNDAFTRLTKRYGCYRQALPKKTFYYWTGRETDRLFTEPDNVRHLLADPACLGLHIHRKRWEKEPLVKGSFWDWAQQQ